MSLFATFRSWFSSSGLGNDDGGPQKSGSDITSTDAGINLTDERAMSLSGAWACTQIITNSIASLPMDWWLRNDDGRTLLRDDHYLTRLFVTGRPNRYMKVRDFRKALTFQMALWNNAYAHIEWKGAGKSRRVVSLTPLHPARMRPYADEHGMTYHYGTTSGIHVFAAENILHLKGITVEGKVALDRLSYGRHAFGATVAADTYASKQFANGGRAGSVLTVDQILTPDQRDAMRDLYENMSAGAENANRLWLLEGGVKAQNIDIKPDEMQMIETRGHQLSEVARYFGVPDVLIGAGSNMSSAFPASFEQQVLAFLTFTLQAYIDEWESALVDALVLPHERRILTVDHDVAGFIKMDSKAKASYWSSLTQNGIATRNEARKSMKLPKKDVAGADDLTVQLNLAPIEALEKIGGN